MGGKSRSCSLPRGAWRRCNSPGQGWADSITRGVMGGKVEITRFLIEHGADATSLASDGRTPLHEASWSGSVEVARLLVDYGADATAPSKDGRTPLHKASWGGRVEV